MALRPHPSRRGSETASSHPAPCQKDVRRGVRRGDWGQRTTATKDPNSKRLRREVYFPTRANGTTTFPIPCPDEASASRVSAFSIQLSTFAFRLALQGHHMPAQGANPGNPPGKTNAPSEGTPPIFVSRTSSPVPPYAVFLQNTPILSDAVPRAMPWADMRCPFRAKVTPT